MKHIRICSVLLALILAFSSLPLSVIAENTISFHDKNQVILDQNFTTETTDESDNVFIVQEDTTKRGEFEKHYICSNGTYVVASYAEAIHYKDDNGEWIDVDNRPVQTAKGDYTTRNGDFGISVPSSTGDGHLMRMDKGEHSLSWTLSANKKTGTIKMDSNVSAMAQRPIQSQKMQVGATKRPEIIVSNTEQPLENHKIHRDEATFELPNVSGKVRYDDLFGADEGVSVVYTTYRNKIEEDIYIEKPTDITSFSMEVAAPDLTPRLNADNSVDFLDNDGKMCYHVGIPYMMDADFAVLNDIETTVIRSGDIWVITYTPDAEWFTSEERVYPILLDPSITTNEYRTNMQDTYVEEGDNTVHSSEQLLYINGGTGNRKAVIRFLTLPAIDDTMPLISASLTLYSQYSPFSDVFLKLAYSRDNVSTSISSYTYAAAANATSLYTSYGTLVTGSTSVTFNLTNCIYEMYESGRDDLILGYSSESDTTFCYPFHSVDTTTDYKPTLKVVYGYSIPETENSKLGNGKIIALKNVGTGAYMTANESLGSNVYQQNVDEITNNQRFRMKYMSDTGGYRLYAMGSSSGKIVGIQPTNGIVYGTKNVSLYTPDNPNTQEWLIIPVSASQFRIVSRTDTSKCLTAYPGNAGSATTTAASTSGNVYATTVSEGNNNQIWWLHDTGNVEIVLDNTPASINTDDYYISNYTAGKYMHRNALTVKSTRETIQNLGENNVNWRIVNLNDGYCVIQHPSQPICLAPCSDNVNSELRMVSLTDSISDECRWVLSIGHYGGFLLCNKKSNLYLTADYTTEQLVTTLYMKEKADLSNNPQLYKLQTWHLMKKEDYRELNPGYSFYDLIMNRHDDLSLEVKDEYDNAHWIDSNDFIFSVVYSTNDCISLDNAYGRIRATGWGYAEVKAIHKITNLESEIFTVLIPCGGIGSKNARLHDTEYVENENCYECSRCFCRIDTPEMQDKDILSTDDYRYVFALQIAYVYCTAITTDPSFSIEEKNNAEINAITAKIMIDGIRRKSEYINKYDYSDLDGLCIESFVIDHSYDVYEEKKLKDVVDDIDMVYYSGLLTGLYEFVLGGVSDTISTMQTISSIINNDMDIIDVLLIVVDTYSEDNPIIDFVELTLLGLSITDTFIAVSDVLYQVCVSDLNNDPTVIIVQYSEAGMLKRIYFDEPLF